MNPCSPWRNNHISYLFPSYRFFNEICSFLEIEAGRKILRYRFKAYSDSDEAVAQRWALADRYCISSEAMQVFAQDTSPPTLSDILHEEVTNALQKRVTDGWDDTDVCIACTISLLCASRDAVMTREEGSDAQVRIFDTERIEAGATYSVPELIRIYEMRNSGGEWKCADEISGAYITLRRLFIHGSSSTMFADLLDQCALFKFMPALKKPGGNSHKQGRLSASYLLSE